ncbi:hypothetical protein T10_7193 [Trichinella papuae]|uniref:Uncharacterized protein n=1 Tax=Trichinella papuae TaxID=268474 RepID=A0A0V1M976_9BILA|nr:hypothetical protein T10_7193 [Trichinella papuae]
MSTVVLDAAAFSWYMKVLFAQGSEKPMTLGLEVSSSFSDMRSPTSFQSQWRKAYDMWCVSNSIFSGKLDL